jgi:hypothetical protein
MGEGADRLSGSGRNVGQVEGEIERLRSDLGRLVGELDRRRHEAFDLKLQARRHPVAAIVAASAVALVLGGLVALAVRRRQRRRDPVVRAKEVRSALRRIVDHPNRVGAEPSLTDKVLGAAGVVAATALTRRLVERTVALR